jgi:hypothetical protein
MIKMMKGMPDIMVGGRKRAKILKSNGYIHTRLRLKDKYEIFDLAYPIQIHILSRGAFGQRTFHCFFPPFIWGGFVFFVVSMIFACANATMWQRPSSASSHELQSLSKRLLELS